MRGEWAYYESLFSTEQCESIIERGAQRTRKLGNVGVDAERLDTEMRHAEVAFIKRIDREFEDVFQTIDYFVEEANEAWFGVRYHRHGARFLQFGVYKGGDETRKDYYKPHQDGSLISGNKADTTEAECDSAAVGSSRL